MSDVDRFNVGEQIRSDVLGAEHVARSREVSEFSQPIQQLVTEYCWGTVWARPGLARRDRSLINLAMIAALNRAHELRIHVAGALRNGCTPGEIQEVLLQVAIYCGVPAGMEAFRIADEVLRASAVEEVLPSVDSAVDGAGMGGDAPAVVNGAGAD